MPKETESNLPRSPVPEVVDSQNTGEGDKSAVPFKNLHDCIEEIHVDFEEDEYPPLSAQESDDTGVGK
jgi:hypothetical protein